MIGVLSFPKRNPVLQSAAPLLVPLPNGNDNGNGTIDNNKTNNMNHDEDDNDNGTAIGDKNIHDCDHGDKNDDANYDITNAGADNDKKDEVS